MGNTANFNEDGSAARVLEPQPDQAVVLEKEAVALLTLAKVVVVKTAEEYRKAGETFAAIKYRIKEVEAERVKRTGPLNQSLKLINADFTRIKETMEAALRPYEAGMLSYKREEERLRKEAEAAAELERKRLEDEARAEADKEMARLEQLRKDAVEAQRQAAAAPNPIAAYLAQAQAEAAAVQVETATEAVKDNLRQAAMVRVPVVAEPKATAAGTSFRKTWKARVTNKDLVPRELMIPDEQTLNALAKETKGPSPYPGVEFYAVESIGG